MTHDWTTWVNQVTAFLALFPQIIIRHRQIKMQSAYLHFQRPVILSTSDEVRKMLGCLKRQRTLHTTLHKSLHRHVPCLLFPMKGAVYFISGGLEQKGGTPSTLLGNKNKNDFAVLYLFKMQICRLHSNLQMPFMQKYS